MALECARSEYNFIFLLCNFNFLNSYIFIFNPRCHFLEVVALKKAGQKKKKKSEEASKARMTQVILDIAVQCHG